MTELPDDNYASPFMITRRIADGLRRKAAEYRKGDKPQRAEGCDEDADALDALLLAYQERGRALETIAESHDAGRHDGLPEACPAHDADTMFAIARAALNQKGKSHD